MNMMEDLRYVDPGDTRSFGGAQARLEAWKKSGKVGKYLRGLDVTAIVVKE